MGSIRTRTLSAIGFSVLFSLTAACGGTKQEAKAPEADTSSESAKTGSSGPDPAEAALLASNASAPSSKGAPSPTSDPPKDTTKSATADGSDIVPPFSSGAAVATAKTPATKTKTTKKGKKKKKTDSTAMN